MLKLKCLQTAVLKHRSKPMREVLKCCSQILGGYVKKKNNKLTLKQQRQ